jgi:hypothetical protein
MAILYKRSGRSGAFFNFHFWFYSLSISNTRLCLFATVYEVPKTEEISKSKFTELSKARAAFFGYKMDASEIRPACEQLLWNELAHEAKAYPLKQGAVY